MDAFFRKYFPKDYDVTTAFEARVREVVPGEGDLLDLGCGDLRRLASFRTPARRVWGTDLEAHPRLADPAWFRPLTRRQGIPFPDDSFDVIASTWVLEHVTAPHRFLCEVYRVLRPGGRFVVLTCNSRHYVTWITRLLHALPHDATQSVVQRLYGRPPRDTFPAHFRLNSEQQLRRAAQRVGLKLAAFRGFANTDYFAFCPPLYRLAVLADWLLERWLPGTGRLYFLATLEKPAGR